MPLSPPEAPVAKGRKSETTRWLDILPTGAPLNTEQELQTQHFNKTNTGLEHSASRGVAAPVTIWAPTGRKFQYDFLQPHASRLNTPPPQTPSTRPHPPLGRPYTLLDRTPILPSRPQTPSSRPQTPRTQASLGKQRPPSIAIPSQSRACGGVIPYNPAGSLQDLRSPPPIAHGRRSVPVEALSSHNMLPLQPSRSIAPRSPVARGSRTLLRDATYMSIPRRERGLLIIGSSHRDPTTYAAKFPPLWSVKNDRDRLRTAFQSRKYSVETMVEEEGNKKEILRRVGNFLASAEGGDIRMIVFTGHGDRIGTDQQFAIIPSGCSSEDDTITSAEWQSIVLENAVAGVVVVSVFATCMSGAVMEQSEKLTNFDRIIERQSLAPELPNGPIHIILSSSGDTQSSFEYLTPSHHSGLTTWHDHFLWALAETIQRAEVNSWELFMKTLQTTFNYVRTAGFRNSSFQYPRDLEWLLHHPQTPQIFVSSQMPDFDRFLPPNH